MTMIQVEPDKSGEEWRPVVDFEGLYEISNLGRCRSVARIGLKKGKPFRVPARMMRTITNKGYPRVTLHKGKQFYCFIHQMVAKAFIGPCRAGEEVRHKDGIRDHCWLSNLEYGTRAANIADSKRHGTFKNGASHLTEELVRQIAARHEDTAKILAAEFGVSPSVINHIRTGRIWRHLNLELRADYYRRGGEHPSARGAQKITKP